MPDKEYGFNIAKNLFVDMTMIDIHKYVGKDKVRSVFDGTISFEEAEAAVKAWRKDRTLEG